MTTRQVKINGTELTVAVPIYVKDWVNFIAIDEDGEIWMFENRPYVSVGDGSTCWMPTHDDSECDQLPQADSERNHPNVNMIGIDWKSTLTPINRDEAKKSEPQVDYLMPAMTDEQREKQIARALAILEADENGELYYWTGKDVLNAKIALAALKAEPVSDFYHDKKWGWYERSPGDKGVEWVKLYLAPPVPALKPIRLMKNPTIRDTAHETQQAYAEGVIAGLDAAREAIRAAGYEVKE